MDYEKKYKESLALMVDCIPDEDGYVHVRPQDIFPELKESEDEKIRKVLINFFSKGAEYDSSTNGIKDRNIIAWLEKQGEQKTAWSEDDEEQVSIITNIVKAHCGKLIDCSSNLSWLQSLKQRIGG